MLSAHGDTKAIQISFTFTMHSKTMIALSETTLLAKNEPPLVYAYIEQSGTGACQYQLFGITISDLHAHLKQTFYPQKSNSKLLKTAATHLSRPPVILRR